MNFVFFMASLNAPFIIVRVCFDLGLFLEVKDQVVGLLAQMLLHPVSLLVGSWVKLGGQNYSWLNGA